MKSHSWLVIWLVLYPSGFFAEADTGAVETKIKTVMVDPKSNAPVVVLESVADRRLLPIWVGAAEAQAIALELEGVKTPRPLTHDLMRNILTRLGAILEKVTVTELRNNTYYALLHMRLKGEKLQVDARPSDAIALALRMRAPIFASAQVFAASKAVPARQGAEEAQRKLGIQAQDLTADLAALFDAGLERGIVVTEVETGGPAAAGGLHRGDIITKADDSALKTAADLESVVRALQKPARIRLQVIRKGKRTNLIIDLPS